ncbi:MAG: hypothetical protein KDD35_09630 [Bdellovibrionales bacterium]|nr:hypothetical protein [Bdellovibrionales bacterium]
MNNPHPQKTGQRIGNSIWGFWRQFLKAKPASENQKVWLNTLVESTRTGYGLAQLQQLLTGKTKLDQQKSIIFSLFPAHQNSLPKD